MTEWLEGLVSLLYPRHCLGCDAQLLRGEQVLCTFCRYQMPRTDFHDMIDNPVARHFWGKVNIQGASALYFYNQGHRVKKLIHNLKYRHKKEAGVYIGRLFGRELKRRGMFSGIDEIIPVPLHPSRLRSRGYNQSWYFAAGLAESLNVSVNGNLLVRVKKNSSQTRKHRYDRWKNVSDVFALARKPAGNDRHYLVVDDVITTGSTAAACAEVLLNAGPARVSIASIAFTHHV